MVTRCRIHAALFVALILLLPDTRATADERSSADDRTPPVDFNRDIRPILSDKCFQCHGPDPETRQADLRLDHRENAVSDDGPIVAGRPEDSPLYERIISDDSDLVMPPPDSGKQVTPKEAALIEQWIQQGAAWSEHWAFVVPQRPAVPPETIDGSDNPIDHFVARRLKQKSMVSSAAADRTTLIRRLSLDLTGLPPTPTEVDAFVNDQNPDAWERLVERMLESPHFGERWARWWLDAARYADSDGYEKDMQRNVWFYRNWVIQAMNDDKPYDEFIIEQIAGDLLSNATQDQRVATGFLRNSMVNEEGGADPEQFRVEGMFDRMDAIGKAILGITTQCAQCHSHKYDPLTQREYYRMFAALNDFHEASITVYTPDEELRRQDVLSRIRQAEERLCEQTPGWKRLLTAWEDDIRARQPQWENLIPKEVPFSGTKYRVLSDGSILCESFAPAKGTDAFSITADLNHVTAFRVEALTHPQLSRGGPGRSKYGTGAITEFQVDVTPASGPTVPVKWASAASDVNPPETRIPAVFREKDAENDKRVTGPIAFAIDGNNNTAWTTDNGPGRRQTDRSAVFVCEQPLEFDGDVAVTVRLHMRHGGWNSDDVQNYLLGRYRFSVTRSDAPTAGLVSPAVLRALNVPSSERTPEQQATVFSAWRESQEKFAAVNAEIEALWADYPEGDSQLVARAMPKPRPTFVLTRGDFLKPTEEVTPGSADFLGRMKQTPAPDRLDFARWLVDERTPTTARAIVNRVWQAYFGQGLVTTPEDLGFQSEPPSHPELLDWLAVELMDHDWSLRHIHRLIVQSATYRQSSYASSEQHAADPLNRWLARGARFRVDAESVRDIALAASGLLNPRIGGPSVYPEAPGFLFQPPASYGPKNWFTSAEEAARRRSLYVHVYRSVPYPPLQVFDAPKGDAACVRRSRSNTPLQALVVLNEPQFVRCAQAMADRVLAEGGDGDDLRVQFAHQLCVSRRPTAKERAVLRRLLDAQRTRLENGQLDARAIAGDNGAGDVVERAAWTIVCRVLLNLDETITRE